MMCEHHSYVQWVEEGMQACSTDNFPRIFGSFSCLDLSDAMERVSDQALGQETMETSH